jgi:hypothetical protein
MNAPTFAGLIVGSLVPLGIGYAWGRRTKALNGTLQRQPRNTEDKP